jgi:hypothetical protein
METKMITRLFTIEQIRPMVKALKECDMLIVEKTPETIKVSTRKGKVVFQSLKKGSVDMWITRMYENLLLVK